MRKYAHLIRWGLGLGGVALLVACNQSAPLPASRKPGDVTAVADAQPGEAPVVESKVLVIGEAPKAPASRNPITADPGLEWQLPNEAWKQKFADEAPIVFLNRTQNAPEWDKLPKFWNEVTEKATDPLTGQAVERTVVKLKVPLGLTQNPPIPPENPMTLARWKLGKRLYFDEVLSSDNTVACASCHDPKRGFTDQAPVSSGIHGLKGGVSAPSVLNSGYHFVQFWDGRAASLEDQAQGPVQNPIEMFDGEGHAWNKAVERVRAKGDYKDRFREAFGTDPTRDAIAKAIAAYERTVLSGNSIHDRADLAMRVRVEDEGTGKFTLGAKDYEAALKDAVAKKDDGALKALGLEGADAAAITAASASLARGRELFFNKARCSTCHVGDNFTDNAFHNLGVGVKDGKLPEDAAGRFARLPTGHKNAELMGAFKTPTVRGLVGTGPYLHDGSEATLEKVVEFYDRGGNANEFLDPKMRDFEAEKAYVLSKQGKGEYKGPEVKVFTRDGRPVVPLKLGLTEQEKKDLVLFLKALQGDPVDPSVGDKETLLK